MNYKITGNDGKTYGPVSAEQIRLWIAQSRVESRTPIFVEGASDCLTCLLRFVDLDHEFGDVGQQAGIVLFLQRHAAGFEPFHLANENDQRGGIVKRGVQSDHGV